MAADAQMHPSDTLPPNRRRSSRRARRVLRRFVFVFAGAAVLLALVHLPAVQRLAGRTLARLLSRTTDVQVTFERFDYRLWAGEAAVQGLSVRRPGVTVACPRAVVRLGASGMRVELTDARLIAQQAADPDGSPPHAPSRPWAVIGRFAALHIVRGAIELHDRGGAVWLLADGIDAHVEKTAGHARGAIHVARADLSWPGAASRVAGARMDVEIEVDLSSGALHLVKGRLAAGETDLTASGRLDQLHPTVGSVQASGRLDGPTLAAVASTSAAQGSLGVRLAVARAAANTSGTLELEASDLTIARVGPWSGTVRSRIDGRRLLLDSVEVRGHGAQVSGGGVMVLGQGVSALDVRIRAADLAAVAEGFTASRPPIASQADLEFYVQLDSWNLQTLIGTGHARLNARAGRGWPLSGRTTVALRGRRLNFVAPRLEVRQARLELDGSIVLPRDLSVNYALRVPDLREARPLLADAGLAAPPLTLAGTAEISGTLAGRLPTWQSRARMSTAGLAIEGVHVDVDTDLSLTSQGIRVDSFVAQGRDGYVAANGFVPFGGERWAMGANLTDVQLVEWLSSRGVPLRTQIGGWLRVDGPAAHPRGQFALDANVSPRDVEPVGDRMPPAPVRVHAEGSVSLQDLVLEQGRAELAGGRVEASGTWNWTARRLDGRLVADGVVLETLPWLPVARSGSTSTLSARVVASGPVRAPAGHASVLLTANTFQAAALPDVTLDATSDGHEALLGGRLGARTFLSGRLPLREPWPLHLDVDLAELPVTELVRSLPRLRDTEASVALGGHLAIDAPAFSPRDVRYNARITRLDAHGRRAWRAGAFTASGDVHGFDVEGLTLEFDGGGRLQMDGHASFDDSSPDASLAVTGEVPLSNLAFLVPDAEFAGKADVDVRVTGSIVRPEVDGTIRLAGGPGRVGRLRWSDASAQATLNDGALSVEKAHVGVMGGTVTLSGSLPLGRRAEARTHEIAIEAAGLDFGTLVAPGGPPASGEPSRRLSALVDLAGRMSLRRLAIDAIAGEGQLKRVAVSHGTAAVDLESAVTWQLRNGSLSHSTIRLHGTGGTALDVTARMATGGAAPRVQLGVSGDLGLAVAQPLFTGAARLEGLARLGLQIEAGPGGFAVTGGARIEDTRFVLREPPLALDDVTGTLKATGRRMEIVDLKGSVGDGWMRAGGHVALAPSAGPEIDLDLNFERVPLSYPEGLRSRTSGKVRLVGAAGRFRVEGDAVVHRAVYRRETDRTSRSLQLVTAELSALETRGRSLQRIELAVGMRLEEGLRIENEQADLIVDGAVIIGGDLLAPEIRGSLVLREGGRVKLSRATLRIAQGRIELTGFPARAPDVSIQGRTQVTGVLIEVNVSGPLDDFGLSLSAPNRPDLTQGDLATLILTGRTASTAVSEGGAIVAEQLAAALGEAVESGLGGAVFIDVGSEEDLVVRDSNPSQRLNIGVPVGRQLYVIYSQALDRNAPRWIVELRPGGELRLRFISDSEEGDSVWVAHRFSFNVWSRRGVVRQVNEPAVRINRLVVEGVPPAAATDLRRVLGLESGSTFDYFRGEESARALTEALRRQGFLAAVVEFADREAGPGRVDVTFRIRRGPRLDIVWRGDDPGNAARRRVEQGWNADLPVEESAEMLARNVRRVLQAARYYAALVTAEVTGTPEHRHVIFEVRRGQRASRIALRFEGNEAVPAQTLTASLPPTSSEAFFSLLDADGRTRLGSAIRLAYAREGFLEAAAGAPRQDLDANTGVLTVTIPVEEGPRARVVSLDLPAYVRAAAHGPPLELDLSAGDSFRIGAYVEDRNRLASWYREQGYLDARVTGMLRPVDGGLAVHFGVDPGPQMRVGEIRVARPGHTRASVVRDAVTLEPGDLIRPAELARSRQRLSETGVFRSIDIRPDPAGATDGTRDIVVDLAPRADLALEYSVRYTKGGDAAAVDVPSTRTSDEVQFGAAAEASNPFGFAHRYRFYGLVGGERALLGLTFEAASFFGHRWRTQVFVFDDQDLVPEIPRFLGRVRGATFQQTKRWRDELGGPQWQDRVRMLWGYTFKRVRYSDPASLQSVGGDRAGLFHSVVVDRRDSMTDPHRGLFASVGTGLALTALGSEADYVKLFGQFYYYVPFGARVVWAQGYRLGVTPGDDPLLLLDGRFRAGGASSVRGFEENMLGPLTSLGEPLGGQALAIVNQELRFPLFKRLWGGVFYDTGNAFALVRDLRLDALRQSAGAGLRFMFPFGPVRLEHAWVLDPREGESRSRWVFSLGHAF